MASVSCKYQQRDMHTHTMHTSPCLKRMILRGYNCSTLLSCASFNLQYCFTIRTRHKSIENMHYEVRSPNTSVNQTLHRITHLIIVIILDTTSPKNQHVIFTVVLVVRSYLKQSVQLLLWREKEENSSYCTIDREVTSTHSQARRACAAGIGTNNLSTNQTP